MANKLEKLWQAIAEPKITRILVGLRNNGYLHEVGWFNAYKTQTSVDAHNEPIPWVTYAFIDFIEERLTPSLEIFEFGSGNSTLYYAKRVKSVIAVEHDKAWHEKINEHMPANVQLLFEQLSPMGKYQQAALNTGKRFDVIIVDGRQRVECILHSLDALQETGVLVLDDAERPEYKAGIDFMVQHRYKYIPFWGIAPGVLNRKATTLFYRPDNILGI